MVEDEAPMQAYIRRRKEEYNQAQADYFEKLEPRKESIEDADLIEAAETGPGLIRRSSFALQNKRVEGGPAQVELWHRGIQKGSHPPEKLTSPTFEFVPSPGSYAARYQDDHRRHRWDALPITRCCFEAFRFHGV